MKWAKAQLKFAETPFYIKNIDIAEPWHRKRRETWTKIIKCDYHINMLNKIKNKL